MRDGARLRPLSFPQERIWFLQRLGHDAVPYQFQMALRLRGRLDVAALERALTEVVRRHEILRTTFHEEDGAPGQLVHPPFPVELPVTTVADEATAWAVARQAVAVHTDPERLPLIRWSLLRLAPGDHMLIQVEHHLVHDGWSLAVLLREVVGLYGAFAQGLPSPLPELELQFADLAAWQREHVRGDVLDAHLAYWRERLRDLPPPLDLPLDRPRPARQTFRGGLHRSLLPAELYAALKEACRREGVTLYVLLLAAFGVLLQRVSGQDDVIVASGFANRERPESEPLIGMVVNTLPIRVDLGGGPSFRDLLARVRSAALGAHEHQETPFEAVVNAVAGGRDLGVNALHQVLFSFHDSPVPDLELPGLSGQLVELHNGTAKADLNVIVMPRPEQRAGRAGVTADAERVQVWWEYAADLFDEATVAGLARRYLTLLRGVVARPGAPIAELPLLTPEEQAWTEPERAAAAGPARRPAEPEPEALDRPLSPTEALVADVWSDVLGVPVTGAGTDFFAAGGHSLSVGRVVARLARRGRTAPMHLLFEHPTLAAFAAALDRDEAAEPSLASMPATAEPEPSGELLPVSSAQQRLWLVDQMHPGLPAYNICRAIVLDGPLDVAALERALTDLAARHEALRTTFRASEGEPQQRIAPPEPLTLATVAVAGEEEARERAAAAAARPFDLGQGPLFRAELLALGHDRHWLLLTLHHVIADGWTVGRLLRDLAALYGAQATGAVPDLPEAAPYRDYARWQREWLATSGAAAQLAFWRERVAGLTPLDLPADRPRPAVPERRGGLLTFSVPPELLPALRGGRAGTVFPALLAAFFVLLHRTTGQRDLAVGVPVANRPRREWEGTAGFFVNSLVIRVRVDGDPTFRALRDQVRGALLDGLDRQSVPFEWLVEAVRPERVLSHNPLFDVSFGMLGVPAGDPVWPGLTARVERLYGGRAKLDLNVELVQRGDEIEGMLEYDRDLFDAATAEALRDRYLALLRTIAADPEARVGSLPVLAPGERARLESLGAGLQAAGYPRDASICGLFAEVAGRVPGRVAVVAGERSLTYAALDRRSDEVAGALAAAGVRRGEFVGISGGRSPDLVVAILGVLKAGAAYAPLDESNPPERLRRIQEDTRMRVTLDTKALPPGGAAPAQVVGPLDAAYVMFTSGSTGEPKGVVVPHRAVVRLARGGAFAEMGREERWLHLAPDAFDASTLELWAPLLNGGTVVMAPAGHVSLGEIGELVRRHRVTSLWLTAGLFHAMVDENVEGLRGLRRVLSGGDTLSAEHVRRALGVVPEVINGYGPTENTTFTAVHVMRSAGEVESPVPIGRPIEGTTVQVVDERGELVPPGVVGELVTGGDGVALGYLGRPGATAARFAPDPMNEGGRLYRTGDYARWRPDGTLEFAGRRDSQVKIRGHRVELGEVEAALAAHERVGQAVVVLERRVAGEERLVAYVVGEAEPAELEAHLRGRLPEPMVPRAWVRLGELPLGPTGKVDRSALPSPSAAAAAGGSPLTPTEELVAGLFGELVGASGADRDADFFALGGHSLLATRLVARLSDRAGVAVPLSAVFSEPTVGGLAAAVVAARTRRPALRVTGRRSRVPLSFAQERQWFLYRYRPGSAVYDIPIAFDLAGPLDRDALAAALQAVVDRHPALRTVYREEGGRAFQTILDPGVPVVLAEREAAEPFDLGVAPLLRASLTRLGPDHHRLLLVLPHIAADGTSLPVLVRDLAGAYAGPLPPPGDLTYADYALWQRQVLEGPPADALAAYWRETLAGAPAVLALPTDFAGPERPSEAGAAHRVRLPAELVAAARRFGAGHGATLYATLLAAFQVLLHRASGETDLVVGAPVAGRDDPALAELVGLFVNTLPVRGDLGGDPTFGEVVKRARAAVQGALAHAELPFDRIVEAVRPARVPGHEPLVQALFQLQPAPPGPFRLGEAEARIVPSRHEVARLDLTVSLFEAGDEVTGFWEYRTDLFEAATIARLARRFEEVLRAAVEDPDLPVADLPLGAIATARRRAVAAAAGAAGGPEAPLTELELTVAGIWEELLGGTAVGRDSDFFALGGHSIVALRLVARLREALDREVPLSALFEHPTLAAFAEQVEAAPPAVARPPLTARLTGDEAALSFAQERHWVLSRLEPGSPAHNVPLVFRLRGELDVAALERALTAVAARQGSLRTVFAADGSRQRLLPPAPVTLRTIATDADLEREMHTPFALDAGPPWRVALLRRSAAEHLLALTLHHVIADGWSMTVLLEDLRAAYEGAALGPLPVQYADYAMWQREWLQGEALERALAYWRHLEGVPMLRLPADRPRPAVQAFRGGSLPLRLPPGTRSALAAAAAAEGATLFMAALTAFAAALHRHSGQTDFAVGTFSANRDEVAVERVAGFFVNNLALRCDVSGDPTWRELLRRVRDVTTGAFAHQEVPFERVLDALKVERALSHAPLFQAMCVLQSFPEWPDRMGDLTLELVRQPHERADYDVTLWLREAPDGWLNGGLEYDRDLFDEPTIAALADTVQALAVALAADPDGRVAAAGRAAAAPAIPQVEGTGLWAHERVAAQAARTPDAVALTWLEEGTGVPANLTYGELRARADRLARRLRALGVRPEDRVGVLVERSADAVAAFLGVLAAGGAYLPVDPEYPPDRVAMLLEDARAGWLVTTRAHANAAAALGVPAVLVDDPGNAPDTPLAAIRGDQLAYVIHTSGSTGRPKGVMVTHASLRAYLDAICPPLALAPGDRVLNFASVSFDATTEELYPALLAGASVVLRPAWLRTPDAEFEAFLAATAPTVLSLPVTFWHAWVDRLERVPEGVRMLLLNAEAPSVTRHRRWVEAGGAGRRWINTYGPTEATVTASLYEPNGHGPLEEVWGRFPIGTPLANTVTHVLDAAGWPVPDGTPGELHLGGAGVTRGYLGQPGVTAAAYVPDPFSARPGARLYRTGDLVRRLPTGELDYLGRLDAQVKIRGHRVELGEVEAALDADPAVRELAVVVAESGGERRLIAYVALEEAGDAEAVRARLRALLPPYMVPVRFVRLPCMPLTPNGKVDRRALAARLASDLAAPESAAGAPPRTPAEAALLPIWEDVLGRRDIGVHDNFFALGGDSIMAMRLVARAREEAGLPVEPRDLFRHQTIAELAASAAAEPIVSAASEPPAALDVPESQISALLDKLNSSPSPLAGEGWGGGD